MQERVKITAVGGHISVLVRSPEPLVPEPDEGDHEPDRDHPQPDVEDDVGGGGGAVDAVLAVQLIDLDKRGETVVLAHDKTKKCFFWGEITRSLWTKRGIKRLFCFTLA